MTDDAAFALRLATKMKDAAGAIAALRTVRRLDEEGDLHEIKVPSINESLKVLINEGMRGILKSLIYEVDLLQQRFVHYQTMMEFLISRPETGRISSADLPEGSPTQAWLTSQNSDGVLSGPPSLDRIEVANTYARDQDRLNRLNNAVKIIEEALVPDADNPKARKLTPGFILFKSSKFPSSN